MTARCHCRRPVPESSLCGCCCANHDAPTPWHPLLNVPAPLPTPSEQAVIDRFGIFDEEPGS